MNYILAIFGFGNTKKTTDTTNKYDPQSMNIFHQMGDAGSGVMQQYTKDPLTASYFQNQVGMLNRVSQQIGQRSMNSLIGQRGMSGGGGIMPGWLQSNIARIGRNTGAMQGQNVLTSLMNAESRRFQAGGNALNYRPLQTGQKSEEQTSGLGTWLPQVIGMAAQGAMAFGTGGASAIGMGAGKAAGGIAGAGGGASSFFHPGGYISQNTNPLGSYNFGGN